jgi:hypothetical protein
MSETEGMTERELTDWFAEEVFSEKPRSVGEALAAADAPTEPPAELPEATDATTLVDEPPVEVVDEPVQPGVDTPEGQPEPEVAGDVELEPEEGDIEEDTDDDENVVWAKKKYGDEPAKWAQAARHQEQHISRLAQEKKEAEELAGEWYEYAQGIQAQAQQQSQMGMPMSQAEENWVEQSIANPLMAARQAAQQGNVSLYNGVIARIAEENPLMAAQIGAQIQMEMQQLAAEQQAPEPQPSLADAMGYSIQRLGIDLSTYGEPMSVKIAELGEHHPYVQTILEGDQAAREIALMAVYDLVRTSAMSTRKVRSEERDEQIRHEAELRRQAAGVVTGGPQQAAAPPQDPFMAAMEQELRDRGQWRDE